jgi:hypothetical protein
VIEAHGILVEGLSYDGEPIDAVYMSARSSSTPWSPEPAPGCASVAAPNRWTNLQRMIRRRTRPFGAIDAIGHFIT